MSTSYTNVSNEINKFFLGLTQRINAYSGFNNYANLTNISIMNVPVVTFSMLLITTIILSIMIAYEKNEMVGGGGGSRHKK